MVLTDRFRAAWLLAFVLLTGCAGTGAIQSSRISTSAPDQRLADSLLLRMLDGQGLYTIAGHLKPLSADNSPWYPLLKDSLPAATTPGPRVRAALDSIAQMERALAQLNQGELVWFVHPYRMTTNGTRSFSISVVNRRLLAAELQRHAGFWSRYGFTAESDPRVVVTFVEQMPKYDRWRAYGYLFGYPDHAVDFFVHAGRSQDSTGQFVKRAFRQLPTYQGRDGLFTYAVPVGDSLREVDRAYRTTGDSLVSTYRTLRSRNRAAPRQLYRALSR